MKTSKMIGDVMIEPSVLAHMRASDPSGRWAAYQNHDLEHSQCGRVAFLQYGKKNTFKTPPERYPDTPHIGLGWRYILVGFVNLQTGEIQENEIELS